jgi:GDP-L-fucose synthase
MREFLWSEEMADACVFVMERVNFADTYPAGATEIRNCHINIGTGEEISIRGVSELIKAKVGFQGELFFNATKPDGTLKKLTNVSKLNALGWRHKIGIEEGVERLIGWYREN